MKRYNYSDQIISEQGTLYLQTHTTDDPPAAESLLFEQGRVLCRRTLLLPESGHEDACRRAAEEFHMNNLDALERSCGDAVCQTDVLPAAALQSVAILQRWNLDQRALARLQQLSGALEGDAAYWRMKGESLLRLERYMPALTAFRKAHGIDPSDRPTLILLAVCMLSIVTERSARLTEPDTSHLAAQAGQCLDRIAAAGGENREAVNAVARLISDSRYPEALKRLRILHLRANGIG